MFPEVLIEDHEASLWSCLDVWVFRILVTWQAGILFAGTNHFPPQKRFTDTWPTLFPLALPGESTPSDLMPCPLS